MTSHARTSCQSRLYTHAILLHMLLAASNAAKTLHRANAVLRVSAPIANDLVNVCGCLGDSLTFLCSFRSEMNAWYASFAVHAGF